MYETIPIYQLLTTNLNKDSAFEPQQLFSRLKKSGDTYVIKPLFSKFNTLLIAKMNISLLLLPIIFLLYIIFFRNYHYFRSERGIFLLHVVIVFLINIIALLQLIYSSAFTIAFYIITISVYGIYCITFLEIWSLSQGGYSLSILQAINFANEKNQDPNFNILNKIGQEKQTSRIEYLINSGLIEKADRGQIRLTPKGLFWGKILKMINYWAS
jgi:hypothetical protein